MFSVLIVTISITIILLFSNCSDDQAAFSSKQVSFHPLILTHSTNFCRQNRRPRRAFAIAAALSAPPPSPPPSPRFCHCRRPLRAAAIAAALAAAPPSPPPLPRRHCRRPPRAAANAAAPPPSPPPSPRWLALQVVKSEWGTGWHWGW